MIVEIKALENGAHDNLGCDFVLLPGGWAFIPESVERKNFPFGEVITEEVDGVITVTEWIPGVIPEVIENETIQNEE